jgi:putative ABC transport system permease protein
MKKYIDYIFLVLMQLNARKNRTFLTMLAIGIGIGAMFLLISFVFGLQDLVLNRIAPVETLSTADISPGKLSYINDTALAEIKKIDGMAEVIPIINLNAQGSIDNRKTFADIAVNATKPDFITYDGLAIKEGGNFSADKSEALVTTAAKQLFSTPDNIIGKEIYLRKLTILNSGLSEQGISELPENVKIVGVVDDTETPAIYLSIDKVKALAPSMTNSGVKISMSDTSKMAQLEEKVNAMGFEVDAVYDMVEETSQLFNYLQAIFSLFGVIGLFVASIGMFNTMTISLLERTRDIGFMRAFGVTKSSVKSLFLVESGVIGLGGGIVGTSIGIVLAEVINSLLQLLAKKVASEGFSIFIFDWWMILLTIAFSVVLGVITGIYPARRAAKISALEAIRYE